MSILNDIQALGDLNVRQDVDKLLANTAQIADKLEVIWRGLDSSSYRLDRAADRGAMSRIARAAADAALALRRPR